MYRVFQFLSRLVGGYQVRIDLDNVCSIPEIEQICMNELIQSLQNSQLLETLAIIERQEFHIYNLTMDEIRNSKQQEKIYIYNFKYIE